MKRDFISASISLCLLAVLAISGCSSSSNPPVTVAVASNATSLDAGTTAQFTATITNDRNNAGVNWSVSCSAAPCGTISPTATLSEVPATYTAPATPPSNDNHITITATSAADVSKFDSAGVKVFAITVAVSSPPSSLLEGQSAPFAAIVAHDPAKAGVNWTVSCTPSPCSIGSVSPETAVSGAPVMYTAPTNPSADWTITITATSVTNSNNAGTSTFNVPAIRVTQQVSSATTLAGTAGDFAASVSNDPTGQGVTWTLTDSEGATCSPDCGSISLPSTESGAATHYTAPVTPPASTRAFRLLATSITDSTKTALVSITVPAITVSLTPAAINVGINTTQSFSATVQNDSKGGNVNWTLMQSGEPCSPSCGSISPATSATGEPITYSAPESVPSPLNVVLKATSLIDGTKSASTMVSIVNPPSFLTGSYVFQLNGQGGAMVGRFVADGKGNILGGEFDAENASTSLSVIGGTIKSGSYAVKPDGRGTIAFTDGAHSFALAFSVGPITQGAATKGALIQTDETIYNSSGNFELQNLPNGFSSWSISGNFAFGLSGWDSTGLVEVAAGSASINKTVVTNGLLDVNDVGAATFAQAFTKALGSIDSNGRGSFTNFAPTPLTGRFLFYAVRPNYFMSMVVDEETGQVLVGKMLQQTGGPYSPTSVNGNMVFQMQSSGSSSPQAMVGMLTSSGDGTAHLMADVNAGGMMNNGMSSQQTFSGTFAFSSASNGRFSSTPMDGGVISGYMIADNQAFLVDMGLRPGFGTFEPQSAGPFTNASLNGSFYITTLPLVSRWNSHNSATVTSGNMYFEDGGISGICDYNQWGSMNNDEAITDSYDAGSGNGRVTMMSGNSIIYVVSSQKLILLSTEPGHANPYIQVLENPLPEALN